MTVTSWFIGQLIGFIVFGLIAYVLDEKYDWGFNPAIFSIGYWGTALVTYFIKFG